MNIVSPTIGSGSSPLWYLVVPPPDWILHAKGPVSSSDVGDRLIAM